MKKVLPLLFLLLLYTFSSAQKFHPGLDLSTDDELSGIPIVASHALKGKKEECKESIDLSAYMPPVGDQKMQNSCVAWALGYACRSYYNNINDPLYINNGSSQNNPNVISPAFIYNLLNDGRWDKKIKIENAMRLLKDTGSCTYKSMPYKESKYKDQPGELQIMEAQNFKIESFGQLNKKNLVTEIIAQLKSKQPVVASSINGTIYYDAGKNYKLETPYVWQSINIDKIPSGHAIVIVGYNDSTSLFKFMNSMGDKWGNKGYGYITYAIAPEVLRAAYVIKPERALKTLPKTTCENPLQNIMAVQKMVDSTSSYNQPPIIMTYSEGPDKAMDTVTKTAKKLTNRETQSQKKASTQKSKQANTTTPLRKTKKIISKHTNLHLVSSQILPHDTLKNEHKRLRHLALKLKHKDHKTLPKILVSEEKRQNKFSANIMRAPITDSTKLEFIITIEMDDCACDSYQVVVQFFFADINDPVKPELPVLSYSEDYSLSNGQAAIVLDKTVFIGSDNDWKRVSIPLNQLAINKGKTKMIAEVIWFNDDFAIKSCASIPVDVYY